MSTPARLHATLWLAVSLLTGPATAAAQVPPGRPAASSPAAAPTPPAAVDTETFVNDVADAYWWGDFAALQTLYERAVAPGARATSGDHLMLPFRRGLRRIEDRSRLREEEYTLQLERLTAQWLREHPDSTLAQGLYARALVARAWAARGGGYANTVPPQAWADFRRLQEQAVQHLVRNAAVALRHSFGYQTLAMAGRGLSWPAADVWKVAQEGLRKNPDDDGLRLTAMIAHLPKWGGDTVMLDRMIRAAAASAPAPRGDEVYALLYSQAAEDEFDHALFQDSAAEWPRMRQGLRDRLARHPGDAVSRNRLAYFACLAKDREAYLAIIGSLGDKPDLDAWGPNPSRVVADCKRWAAQS